MSKSTAKDFAVQVSAAIVSGLVLASLLSSNTALQSIWTTFPIPSIVFWLLFAFVVIQIGYWAVRHIKKYLDNRDKIDRVARFLNLWDELGKAYESGNQRKVGELMSKGIILYTPIGSLIRSQARATYVGTPDHPIVENDFDLIGNILAGADIGINGEAAWRMGSQAILATLGALGYTPKDI